MENTVFETITLAGSPRRTRIQEASSPDDGPFEYLIGINFTGDPDDENIQDCALFTLGYNAPGHSTSGIGRNSKVEFFSVANYTDEWKDDVHNAIIRNFHPKKYEKFVEFEESHGRFFQSI